MFSCRIPIIMNLLKTIYFIRVSLKSLLMRTDKAPAFSDRKRYLLSPNQNKNPRYVIVTSLLSYRKDIVLSPIQRYAAFRTSFFTSLWDAVPSVRRACAARFQHFCRTALLKSQLQTCTDRQQHSCRTAFLKSQLQTYAARIPRFLRSSLTVEAALELPLFFVFTAIVLQYACVMRTAAQYSGSLTSTAQEMAIAAYKEEYGDANNIIRAALSDAWATARVIDTAADKDAVRYASFLNSSYMKEGDFIRLVLSYQPRPRYSLISLPLTFFVQKAVVRGWTGKDGHSGRKKQEKGDNSHNRTVYVTEHGSVFHTNPDCSHLKVTIIPVTKGQLKNARNTSGGKYKKCPYCGSRSTGEYYVDPYGSCWHTSVTCPSLKRTVHEMDMDECGHMHECKDCRKARGG